MCDHFISFSLRASSIIVSTRPGVILLYPSIVSNLIVHTSASRQPASVLVIVRRARIDDDIVGGRRPCPRPAAAAADASPARCQLAHSYVCLPPTICRPGSRRRPFVRHAAAAAAAGLCNMQRRPPRSPPTRGVRGGRRHTCACRRAAVVLVLVSGARAAAYRRARRPPPHLYTSAGGRRPFHCAPSTH